MQIEFNATKRALQGTGASRRLRRAGKIPGIVYGGSSTPQSIEMNHNEMFQLLRKEAFYSSVLNMNIEGAQQMCLLRDVQRHPYKPLVLHIDFQRIAADQEIHQKVPLHFVNADIAPGVKLAGGMVQHVMTEVDLRCLPKDLPSFVEVDLKSLEAGQSVHVAELVLPKGVTAVVHRGENPVVASVLVRGGGAAAAEEASAAETQVATDAKVAAPTAKPVERKVEKKGDKR